MSTSESVPVIAFGEILWDLLPGGKALGGAPANFAFRLNELGFKVSVISRVGTDRLGTEALQLLETAGLSVSNIQIDPECPSGTAEVFVKDGLPDFTITPNTACDRISCSEALLQQASRSALICFGTLVQRAEISRKTLHTILEAAPQALKLLDINLRKKCYSEETIRASLERADILKLNDDEVEILSGILRSRSKSIPDFCAEVIGKFDLKACLVTLGARGIFALSDRGVHVYEPGYKVSVVDTVGSGDSFSAGFAACYLRGEEFQKCCSYGNALGALVATHRGAMAPLSAEQIEAFMAASHERVVHPDFVG